MDGDIKKEAPLRVLILDDDEGIRRLVGRYLTAQNCRVETVSNGRLGLRALLTRTFDVAVVDIRMQEMDGFAFIEEAKKIWPWQGFVILSGFIDDQARARATREGIRHVIQKPMDMQVVMAAVQDEAIHRENLRRALSGHGDPRELIGHQLRIMRMINRDILNARDLLSTLTNLGNTIANILPVDLMGILSVENDGDPLMLLQASRHLPSATVSHFQQHIIDRYQALAGRALPTKNVRVESTGITPLDEPARELGSLISVPVISGDLVLGMLAIGSEDPHTFDDLAIATLYHCAGILSTMLTALDEMRNLATRDPLTGLYNRRQLDEELSRSWQLANRYKNFMSVLMVDLDKFKEVNDQFGHRAGDQLLKEFVAALDSQVRASDIVARYGGDEFVIILPQASEAEAIGLAHRILDTIRGKTFLESTGDLRLRASIGVTVYDPAQPLLSQHDLIQQADQALYIAKAAGRDTCVSWKPEHGEKKERLAVPAVAPHRAHGRLLLVDDEEPILMVLRLMLEQEGYEIRTATNLQDARTLLNDKSHRFDVMISDLTLPDGSGIDVIKHARETDAEVVCIVVTGNATTDNAIKALREGAFDFIQKPVMRNTLIAAMDRAMRYRNLLVDNHRYRQFLEDMVRSKHEDLTKAIEDIKSAYAFSLETMVAMLDAREFETGQHSIRVRALTMSLARNMGIDEETVEEIGRGALLHDLGKIGIPDAVLLKPGKLTEDEWAVMRKHPEIGHRFLKSSEFLKTAASIVLSHHEHWDGTGYPQGLHGEQISIGARIFSVIDSYDAIRSPRVYKPSIPRDKALAEIRSKAGSQFDPVVVEAFADHINEIERLGCWPK